ncbi:MAG: hypothetical protein JNG83_04740 [Opitutaceae bacterium]|nr:hypothetical protein [Opitutaceae bacterium]
MPAERDNNPYRGPWHIDCRLSAQLPSDELVRGRFLTNAVAVTLAVIALGCGVWQFYGNRALAADTSYWETRLSENRREIEEVNQTLRALSAAAEKIDQAYALVGSPIRLSELVVSLGTVRPPNMRIDVIESHDGGLMVRGSLREPSDIASRTLRSYVEELRRMPAVSAAFPTITPTSLVRQDATDLFNFEITFRPAAPAKP